MSDIMKPRGRAKLKCEECSKDIVINLSFLQEIADTMVIKTLKLECPICRGYTWKDKTEIYRIIAEAKRNIIYIDCIDYDSRNKSGSITLNNIDAGKFNNIIRQLKDMLDDVYN